MKRNSGFTLIELIVVVAIISILISVIIPNYKTYTNKANNLKVVTISEQIAEEIYNTYYEQKSNKESDENKELDTNIIKTNIKSDIGIDVKDVKQYKDSETVKLNFNYKSNEYSLNFKYKVNSFDLKDNSNKVIFSI